VQAALFSRILTADMDPEIDTRDASAVQAGVESIYRSMFPNGNSAFVPAAFGWARDCFNGNYDDYQAIDAHYHDFEHTLQGTLCMAQILGGRHHAGVAPVLMQHTFELGLLAILLHDTGYLKKKGDSDGTGAKYTLTHVNRSVDFAAEFLTEKGFSPEDIRSVQNMIRCTGVNIDLGSIQFPNETEHIVGLALGTGDLLGQMAARDYVEKLPVLYAEFAEAAHYSNGKEGGMAFSSARDLMQKTPGFWQFYVRPKIDGDFQGLYRFVSDPYPDGPNPYMNRIEANISRLKQKLESGA
jgi:hypothetical protein